MNRQQAIEFLENIIKEVGPGFHPDTDFKDYIKKDPKDITFTEIEAEVLNEQINEVFEALGDEIYDISLDIMNGRPKKINYKFLALWVIFGIFLIPIGIIVGAIEGVKKVIQRAVSDIKNESDEL